MATTPAYTLQILHQSDLEAGLLAVNREAQSAAIIDKLEDDYANTLKVISGDTWITGPFYSAEGDPSVQAALRAFYGNSTQAAGSARAGNDTIFAGTGSAMVDGGAGADLVVFVNGRSGGTVVVNG